MEQNNLLTTTIFSNSEFGEIRTANIDNKPYFCANEIAKALGYKRPKDAVTAHCKGAVKYRHLTNGGVQEAKFIPEGDVYRLIIKSKLPEAEKFEEWVMEEVLPSIRKHGGYIAGQEEMSAEELLSRALLVAQSKIEEKDRLLEEQKPKVEFAEAVTNCNEASLDMSQFAKVLQSENCKMGRNKVYSWLRDNKFLSSNNTPYQVYMDKGWFEVIEFYKETNHGPVFSVKVLVTPKGQLNLSTKIKESFAS